MRRMPGIVSFALFVWLLGGCVAETPQDLSRLAGWQGLSPNPPDAFRFVVMSDRTGKHGEGKLRQFVDEVNLLGPDFVMTIGDIIEGRSGNEEVLRKEWRQVDAELARLDAPFFYCPGNHDVPHAVARKLYHEIHSVDGRPYYSFDYRRCHFVVLDSYSLMGRPLSISRDQWAWLARDLAGAGDAEAVFIFMHHPIQDEPGAWPRLRGLIDPGRTVIFAGHHHNHSYDERDGTPILTLPPTSTTDERCAYALVTVRRGRPTIALVPLGAVQPPDTNDARFQGNLRAIVLAARLIRSDDSATVELPNPSPEEAAVTLQWSGPGEPFGGSLPDAETLKIPPGQIARRQWKITDRPAPDKPPVLTVRYDFDRLAEPVKRTMTFALPPGRRLGLAASRLGKVVLDGRLDEWATAVAHRVDRADRISGEPALWAGPEDCSMTTRIGYDDKNLYVAVDVTDEAIIGDSNVWRRDGISLFWDASDPNVRASGGQLGADSGNVVVAVPAPSAQMAIRGRLLEFESPGVAAGFRPREAGYVVELAIPLTLLAPDFRPGPGKTLLLNLSVIDRDNPTDRDAVGGMALSGDGGKTTDGWSIVTFR